MTGMARRAPHLYNPPSNSDPILGGYVVLVLVKQSEPEFPYNLLAVLLPNPKDLERFQPLVANVCRPVKMGRCCCSDTFHISQ